MALEALLTRLAKVGPTLLTTTTRLAVRTRGDGWRRSLELERSAAGGWSIATSATGQADLESAGGDADGFTGSLHGRRSAVRW